MHAGAWRSLTCGSDFCSSPSNVDVIGWVVVIYVSRWLLPSTKLIKWQFLLRNSNELNGSQASVPNDIFANIVCANFTIKNIHRIRHWENIWRDIAEIIANYCENDLFVRPSPTERIYLHVKHCRALHWAGGFQLCPPHPTHKNFPSASSSPRLRTVWSLPRTPAVSAAKHPTNNTQIQMQLYVTSMITFPIHIEDEWLRTNMKRSTWNAVRYRLA